MSAVQAVIWDFGGVISSSPFEAFARFEAERGLPVGFLRKVRLRTQRQVEIVDPAPRSRRRAARSVTRSTAATCCRCSTA